MPRKKLHDEDRRTWSRAHLPPEVYERLTVMCAGRRLPPADAYLIIEEALRVGLPDEYQRAIDMLAKFNHVDE